MKIAIFGQLFSSAGVNVLLVQENKKEGETSFNTDLRQSKQNTECA